MQQLTKQKQKQKTIDPTGEIVRPQKNEVLKPQAITAPKMAIMFLPIKGMKGSPLVVHAFSAKARAVIRATQEAGSTNKKGKKREPKDFEAVYQDARHVSTEGWDGISAPGFRNAAIDACRLAGFKMTHAKLSVFIEPDGIDREDGSPLVRIHGDVRPFEATVRNANGMPDIRVRPRWDDWTALLRIRFDTDQFSADDVLNLMWRAGEQCGIGEGRPNSSASFGQGWGLFEIDSDRPIELRSITRKAVQFVTSQE